MKRAAAFGVVWLALVACSDPSTQDTSRDESGGIDEEGEVGVQRLQVGDCLVLPASLLGLESDDTTEVEDFVGLPCSQEHNGEVVLIEESFFADDDGDWPGFDALFSDAAIQRCIGGLDDYTGTDFADSAFDVVPLVPGEDAWNLVDDRELVCIGVTLGGGAGSEEVLDTTGSIAAS